MPLSEVPKPQLSAPRKALQFLRPADLPKMGVTDAEMERRREIFRQSAERCDDSKLAEFAFPVTQDLRRTVPETNGVSLLLNYITRHEFDVALRWIAKGVSPQTAICRACSITPHTFSVYMQRGGDPAELDPRFMSFRLAIYRALSFARGAAEERVFRDAPLAWLTRGPAARSRPDDPGWTEEFVQRQANAAGSGDPTLNVNVSFSPKGTIVETTKLEE